MSTDEQHMPTIEDVRSGFCVSNGFPAMTRRERGLGFDRWLAERDRQVAEQALRDAAAEASGYNDACPPPRATWLGVRDWLNAHAALLDRARADSAAPARTTTDDREAVEALLREAEWLADPDVAGTVSPAVIRAFAEAAHAVLASRPTTPTPTVSEPGPGPAFADIEAIVSALGVTYSPQGVAIWLRSSNRHLNQQRPIDLLAAGDFETVARAVEALGDVAALGVAVSTDGGEG